MTDEEVLGTVGNEPIRPRFPLHVTAFGISMVLIPEADYRTLVERSSAIFRSGRLSHLDKEPEVRAFILERVGTADVERIREAAILQFGAHRVPSRSALNRMIIRTRVEAAGRNRKRPV